jgi:diacylglycerol kinase
MKNRPFWQRSLFAWSGLREAFRRESSFRTQCVAAVLTIAAAIILQPAMLWLALLVVMIVLVLAAELFNTALESALDGLHPDQAEFVRIAKDCAAGAVLLLSFGAVIVFLLMLGDIAGIR